MRLPLHARRLSRHPTMTAFHEGSRSRLTRRDLGRFAGETLFDRVGRVVCEAECLPRKELYESWEVAKRARRRLRGGVVYDLAAGHGLLAHLLLILDDSSPRAFAVDLRQPASAPTLHAALCDAWPRLRGRVEFVQTELQAVRAQVGDVVVSAHACGALTDATLDVALAPFGRADDGTALGSVLVVLEEVRSFGSLPSIEVVLALAVLVKELPAMAGESTFA